VTDTIGTIAVIAAEVATAVEEQTATTALIHGTMSEQAAASMATRRPTSSPPWPRSSPTPSPRSS
jgi:hypothetical protein